MKLYYSPGACSLAAHIALREAAVTFDAIKVGRDKKTSDGADYNAINPKGYVPALVLDDGQVLTEGPAILQYIADRNPSSGLAPPASDMQRYRLQEWLGFLNSEVHKNFSPFFNPAATEPMKEMARANVLRRLSFTQQALTGRSFLLGERFTVADAYLFTILNWGQYAGIDLGQWPALKALHARVAARPHVQAAMKAEGLSG
ncbi:MAG: glutathione transferase GstA [Gammaproteobacteria bacterium]|nr:glutathione transferase GstA [Gammaproteobacteria bacterium]